jgi:3-oxoacyl-[acyl-carrier-protein] synthase-1
MNDVHIVAAGARTPVGLTLESTAAAIRSRISRLAEHPFMVDLRGNPVRIAVDRTLDPGLFGVDRMFELARGALDEVARKLEDDIAAFGRIGVVLGLPRPRAGFEPQAASALVTRLRRAAVLGPIADIHLVLEGHASALHGLRQAWERLRSGRADLVLVGGVDTHLDPDTLLELDAHGRLAASSVRSGFPAGEGAAFVAAVSDRALTSRGFASLGRITGVHSALEPTDGTPGAPNLGRGLAAAIAGAASDPPVPIDEIYCDINGERPRTEEWGFAAMRHWSLWRDAAAYRTAVAECGDVGAASGGLLVALAARAAQRGYAKGPNAMIWTSSLGGMRAAVTLDCRSS